MKKIDKYVSALLISGLISIPASADQLPKEGNVKGRIVDVNKQTLPGASIYIEDLQTGVISDVNGFYTIPSLKPGSHKVRISYVGYEPVEFIINVPEGKTIEKDIVMQEGVSLTQVNVDGVFTGQARAINMQKNNIGVTNVVSADQVGKFPDSNIGDALKRISGINVQYDQGEARFGQVRGTSADLTSVTVNGNRIPSAEGDTRNVQLDLIPADMIQTIEVNKVVTSDMDGDAIGGSINLVTKNTPYHRVLNFTAGSGYNWISEKPQLNLGFTWGDRFFNDKLGIMVAASYQYAPGGSDNTEFEYVEKKGEIKLKEAQARQYYVTRERQSYSAAFDYKFNANHKLSFKAIYNRRNDWENRYRVSYKKLNSDEEDQSIVIQTKGGSSSNRNARLERQQTMDFTLDGEHNFGPLAVDWAASYSRATEDRPQERYMAVKLKEAYGDSFEDIGGDAPYSTKAIPSLDGDSKWKLDELSNSDQSIYENEWKFKLNFELPISKGAYGNTLKFGGKYTAKEKDRDTEYYDYTDSYKDVYEDEWKNNLTTQIRKGFMAGSQYPIGTQFIDKSYLGHLDFSSLEGEKVYEEMSGNYHANEAISSGYIRFDQKLGERLTAVLGLRMEHTHLKYSGWNWTVNSDGDEDFVSTGDKKNDYTNWLPSVLLKYDVNDDFKVRASYTRTLSRPKYSNLIPCVNYSTQDEEATIGNPNLKPTVSDNFDLSAEYYFKSIGLVSAGIFFKNVQDVIVEEVWSGESAEEFGIPSGLNGDGEAAEYEFTRPINAYDAKIFGVEVAYQRDFGFISPALKCIGFYGNYTYTHSSTNNYKFSYREVEDGEDIKMTGSPEHTANASLFFEKYGLNIRLSYNFASSFIDEMGESAELDRYYDKVNYLDLNASYTWGKNTKFTVYADATNLLNQPLRYYQGTSDRTMQVEYYGVKINAGIKINF